jgi:hypothetical protein
MQGEEKPFGVYLGSFAAGERCLKAARTSEPQNSRPPVRRVGQNDPFKALPAPSQDPKQQVRAVCEVRGDLSSPKFRCQAPNFEKKREFFEKKVKNHLRFLGKGPTLVSL